MSSRRPPVGIRQTLAVLQGMQKTPRGVSLYSVAINRPVGRFLAASAHCLGLTPNKVTVLSALSSFTAIALLLISPPTLLIGVGVAVLLAVGFALDSADGQLARLQGRSGPAGEWLDHLVDCAVKLTLHAAVASAWYRAGLRGPVLLVPLAFQAVTVLTFFGGTLAGLLLSTLPAQPREPDREGRSRLALLPVDYGVLCWSFVLWGSASLFRGWYQILLVVQLVYLVALCRRWWRQLLAAAS